MKNTVSLNRNELFLRAYKKGKKSYGRYFTLHFMENGLKYNRLGIKTGRKLCGAVRRNRIKRLIKESYRLSEHEIRKGFDLVFAAKEKSLEIDSCGEVMKEIRKLLLAGGLLSEKTE